MSVPFSVLDLVPLADGAGSGQAIRSSLELARLADRLGYKRYWFAEHHNMAAVVSTTPEVLIALAGQQTRRIHIGSGGIMLPNHTPLKVAETFKMLHALYPGRVDLGIGRAPGTDPATALALRGSREALRGDDFPERLSELVAYGTGATAGHGMMRGVAAMPADVKLPPVWLLGSGDFSAQLSASLGMGFAFAAHFSDFPPDIPLRLYREQFTPGMMAAPHAILTVSVICADTDEEAQRLASSLFVAFARLRTGQKSLLLSPDDALAYPFTPQEQAVVEAMRPLHIIGSPATVQRRITDLAARTGADEVMVTTFTHGQAERLRSYQLLADAFALSDAVGLSDALPLAA